MRSLKTGNLKKLVSSINGVPTPVKPTRPSLEHQTSNFNMTEPKIPEPQSSYNTNMGTPDTKNEITHISITNDQEEKEEEEVEESTCCFFTRKVKRPLNTSKVNKNTNNLDAKLI